MEAYIQLTVPGRSAAEKDLIIGLLSAIGYDGFEETQQAVHCYITSECFNKAETDEVLQSVGLTYTIGQVPLTNWNEEWERNFQPVVVDNFCCIRASFHPPAPGVLYDIIVTPKMSFGTGHHATTYLMIQQMEGFVFDNTNVLDFGTGTGVLAILAEKMGAKHILAIDNDKWSIENANENIRENGCSGINILEAGFVDTADRFEIILANINRNVLLDQMDSLSQHLEQGGVLIISGLLVGDKEVIEERARFAGLKTEQVNDRDGWIVIKLIHS